MDAVPQRRMMRVSEAANFLGVSVSYLNNLRTLGGSPRYAKIGRAVVYDPTDLEEWVAERRRVSTSDRGDER